MSKNYKRNCAENIMEKRVGMEKRGQVAIFVIIAIAILAILIVFIVYPRLDIGFGEPFGPESYLKKCIQPEIKPVIDILSEQGGYMDPEGFAFYNGTKIKYLCYSSEYYKTCTIQQPMIKAHFEDELYFEINPKIELCADNLKKEYEKRGYSVSSGEVSSEVEFVPGKLIIKFVAPMTVTKDVSETFKSFDVKIDSNMYDLLMTANSILDFESTYGDSETTLYMQYYPDLKIEKTKLSDGTTIYILSNVVSKDRFTFASRSLAWPPGYGLE